MLLEQITESTPDILPWLGELPTLRKLWLSEITIQQWPQQPQAINSMIMIEDYNVSDQLARLSQSFDGSTPGLL